MAEYYVAENGADLMHRGPIQPLRNINRAATYLQRCCMQHLWSHARREFVKIQVLDPVRCDEAL